MGRRAATAEEKDDIDLTPMLDVVFIMLIFFIVTASFVKESSISLFVPENQPDQPVPTVPASMLIQINSDNQIMIDGRRVESSAVRSLVAQRFAENPELSVVVRADELSHAGTYVTVSDAAREAKVSNISLMPFSSARQ